MLQDGSRSLAAANWRWEMLECQAGDGLKAESAIGGAMGGDGSKNRSWQRMKRRHSRTSNTRLA